jgi:hypothetical protein
MLSAEQLPVFRAAIDAATDPEFVEYRTNGQTTMMAAWFNRDSDPAHIVWRSSVTQDEIMQNGFDWVRVDNLSVGKARIWEWLFDNQSATFNPSKANVRAGIDECWKGTAADLAVRAAIYVHCKRLATRAEKLYAVGSGTDASPSLMAFEGQVTDYDVSAALAL